MGTSKAMMEKVLSPNRVTVAQIGRMICGTRYGNVMCSRGSVIPLFIEQIKAGKPLTVTEPKMTRFIMSLEEAVDLVLLHLRMHRAAISWCKKRLPAPSKCWPKR